VINFLLGEIILFSSKEVYHTQRESQEKFYLTFLFVLSISISVLLLSSIANVLLIIEGLVSLFILSLVAYYDIITSRFSVFQLFLSLIC